MKTNTLLEQAREKFPKDTLFLSATGLLKSPMKVTILKLSEISKGVIVNDNGGVIYDGRWAVKV